MAYTTTARPVAGFSVSNLIAGAVARFAAWNDARVTRKALEALTDRELDDLGLSRADVYNISAGTNVSR